ncbi:phosphomannomutase [Neorhizobium sp. AL 9.2.2]|uniref:phosphomannomutase n=1 Tax=Neorhizobium sp. AL 9.2.2 TaxID=2712894 RepID=UPI001572FA36|nr:phosphomannomutase [Neorhizobium sp. AL 9.2.2]NSY19345.1 phosphomannomutase [Neorhizobium sp. AL 9.2.2]
MKFGTSGLRGLVTDLEGRASALYTTAFARHLLEAGLAKPGDPVLVGRDFRASSPRIAATCIGALQRAGLNAIDCGAIPTPALALYGMKLSAAGLMITGSHIPDDRNGIKFYRADGEIDKQDEIRITAIAGVMADEKIDDTPGEAPDRHAEAEALFVERNAMLLAPDALVGLSVGVYQHSTVARDLFVQVLEKLGAQVVPLGRSERFIPVDTEAVSTETIALLQGWAPQYRLDAIVSADGDGDRPLVADEKGQPLRGDLLGLITANFLYAQVVATPVTSNSRIEAAGDYTVVRTKVGSPFVIAAMQAAAKDGKTAIVGFEANGGTLTGSDFTVSGGTLQALPTRDSFLPALATLSLLANAKQPLSRIVADYPLAFAAADRLENFPVETSAALMAHLRASDDNLSAFLAPIGSVTAKSDIDGLRVTLEDGRIIHLRPSGNAPEMRCYVEAPDERAASELLDQGLDLIRHWAAERNR